MLPQSSSNDRFLDRFTPQYTCNSLLQTAARSINALEQSERMLSLGRIRGTGPGVSFGSFIDHLNIAYPLKLEFPFEDSERVGGAFWDCRSILGDPKIKATITKLKWLNHAQDLPIHAHEQADRFIVVTDGRGFFHWSDQSIEDFDGSSIQTIAARDRDVFVFRRGLMHTFSTTEHDMTLLSIQSPFIPFHDPRQYRVPAHQWTHGHDLQSTTSQIMCDLHQPNTPSQMWRL